MAFNERDRGVSFLNCVSDEREVNSVEYFIQED